MLPTCARARSLGDAVQGSDMIQELWDHNVKVGFRCKVIANQCKDIVMGSEAAAMELERRLKVDAPWVFEDDYGVESSFMRRERIVYLYEHGHSLLSAALERDPWTKPVVLFDSACIPPFHL